MNQTTDDARALPQSGPLRLVDLMDLEVESPLLAHRLDALHLAARQIMGGPLAARSLDDDRLGRLRRSLLRQQDDARRLQRRLEDQGASGRAADTLAALMDLFSDSLEEVDRQLTASRRRH